MSAGLDRETGGVSSAAEQGSQEACVRGASSAASFSSSSSPLLVAVQQIESTNSHSVINLLLPEAAQRPIGPAQTTTPSSTTAASSTYLSPSTRRRVRVFTDNRPPPSSPRMDSQEGSYSNAPHSPRSPATTRRMLLQDHIAKSKSRNAQRVNDSMVYLEGPQVYACAQCRTHLTSHDDIISKSFHGRNGRAYLFDHCVNVNIGPAEERRLMTGLHTVCDIYCKRCNTLVGWTYQKAYETSQKYKEGKFIIEKIHLHLEESSTYDLAPPAGTRRDRWRNRSMSWGNESSNLDDGNSSMIFEYHPSSP